ncbi:hypothetical protein M885DRAFT_534133 [Pelagophyceae sp. CCMP2097]|nr:hypothetical protein M885DRAFT_534133 [Pelagophyceae sp. CCMP2097]
MLHLDGHGSRTFGLAFFWTCLIGQEREAACSPRRPLNTGPLNTGPLNTKPLNTGPLNTGPLNTGPLTRDR